MSEPLAGHRPAAGACPQCGSALFKQVKAKRGAALTHDRECKECGTRYLTIPAPLSGTVQAAMYVSGVLLILAAVLLTLIRLSATEGPGGRFSPSPSLTPALFSVMCGFMILSTPQRNRQEREKRLKDYHAFAPPGAPPPVEMPRPADMVALSGMFGALSLASPLVSSLLLVVVFGPAAVVCGVVALAQGHLKGLIGMGLGIVSLIVWGLVFIFVFKG
jgi:hypothetical protein